MLCLVLQDVFLSKKTWLDTFDVMGSGWVGKFDNVDSTLSSVESMLIYRKDALFNVGVEVRHTEQ